MPFNKEKTKLLRRKDELWFVDSYNPNMKNMFKVKKVVKIKKTPFQEIAILDLDGFGRSLVIDGIAQSSEADEFIYHEALIHPAMIQKSANVSRSALVLGLGEGATIRELVKHKNIKRIVAVDIDKEAVDLFREYLPFMHQNACNDPRVEIQFISAIDYLKKCRKKFDFIYSDISDPSFFNLASLKADSEIEFYRLVKRNLINGGIFVTHAYILNTLVNEEHKKMLFTLKKVFRKVVSAQIRDVPFFCDNWGVIMATDENFFSPHNMSKITFQQIIKHRSLTGGKLKYLNWRTYLALFALPHVLKKKLRKAYI